MKLLWEGPPFAYLWWFLRDPPCWLDHRGAGSSGNVCEPRALGVAAFIEALGEFLESLSEFPRLSS